MRKILYLLLFVCVYAFGQKTDDALTTQGNQIRNETTPGANTAVRIGNMFNDLTTSKVNKRTPVFLDSADITKRIRFNLNNLNTGTTRTVTWPDKNGTVAFLDDIVLDTAAADIRYVKRNGFQNVNNFTLSSANDINISSEGGDINFNSSTYFISTALRLRAPFPNSAFYYRLLPSLISGNRDITLPLLANNDTFVFENHTQTLTNKTLTSPVINTQISGTVTSGGNITSTNFLIGATATQTLTNKTLGSGTVFNAAPTINDGFKFTFNPNGTNAGLNFGAHTAAPSSPVNGDVYYNSTTNQLQARINGSWVSLGATGITGSTGTIEGAVVTATTVDGVVIAEELVSIKSNGNNTTLITQIEPTTDSLALVADFVKVNSGNFSIRTNGLTESLQVSSYNGESTLSVTNAGQPGKTKNVNISGLLPRITTSTNVIINEQHIANCIHHTGSGPIDVTLTENMQLNTVFTVLQRGTGIITLTPGSNVVINGKTSTTGQWDMIWIYLVDKSSGTTYYVAR